MNIERYRFIAHRGIHIKETNLVENSLPAFEYAVKRNIAIELDVHLTKDKELVVVHDHNLKNTTGVNKIVEKLTLLEIKEMFLFNTKNKIPTFVEVLNIINGKVPIVIEIKNQGKVGELEKKLSNILKNYKGEYVIESFNPLSLLWFKKNDKTVPRGQLSAKKIDTISNFLNFFLSRMVFNFFTKPDFIAYNIKDVNEKLYEKYRKKEIYLIGWTLYDVEEYDKYSTFCDGLIFDNYDKLKEIISTRENYYEKK